MPCKTVVMPADCVHINSTYYRHMIGRAGRRGFDTIGNIGNKGCERVNKSKHIH